MKKQKKMYKPAVIHGNTLQAINKTLRKMGGKLHHMVGAILTLCPTPHSQHPRPNLNTINE